MTSKEHGKTDSEREANEIKEGERDRGELVAKRVEGRLMVAAL